VGQLGRSDFPSECGQTWLGDLLRPIGYSEPISAPRFSCPFTARVRCFSPSKAGPIEIEVGPELSYARLGRRQNEPGDEQNVAPQKAGLLFGFFDSAREAAACAMFCRRRPQPPSVTPSPGAIWTGSRLR
jgi:hypothetical protein